MSGGFITRPFRQPTNTDRTPTLVDLEKIAALTGSAPGSKTPDMSHLPKQRKRRRKRKAKRETWKMGALLAAIEPGQWYARPDLKRLCPELGYDYVKRKVVDWRGRGWLEQADSPDWRPEQWQSPGGGFVRRTTPRYLFRLT